MIKILAVYPTEYITSTLSLTNYTLNTKDNLSDSGIKQFYIHYAGVDPTSATKQLLIYSTDAVVLSPYSDFQFYFKDSRLYLEVAGGHGEDDGTWWWPCTATEGRIVLTYIWLNTADPEVYLNGSLLSVTESSTPSDIKALTARTWYFGAKNHYGTEKLTGKIGEIAVWDSDFTDYLTTQEKIILTTAKIKRLPLQMNPSKLQRYWALDENNTNPYGVVGTAGPFSLGLIPNSDVSITWNVNPAGNHYSALSTYNTTSYIEATASDDALVDKIGFSTDTIPAGKTVTFARLITQAKEGDAGSFTYDLIKNGGSVLNVSVAGTTITQRDNIVIGSWSQDDIDGAEFWVTAPATIDKGESGGYVY